MRKMKANVNMNDRIFCCFADDDRTSLQYWYKEARTGACYPLCEPFKFSPSVKNYFGGSGKTFRQLYNFHEWRNKRLELEVKWIWRVMEEMAREKEAVQAVYNFDDEERAA